MVDANVTRSRPVNKDFTGLSPAFPKGAICIEMPASDEELIKERVLVVVDKASQSDLTVVKESCAVGLHVPDGQNDLYTPIAVKDG